jgi:hypothetical protein
MTKNQLVNEIRARLQDEELLVLASSCVDCGRLKLPLARAVALAAEHHTTLCAIKARLAHGQWGRAFARAKFPFTIRTATRAMQTYHRFKADPALLDDPESFMAQIYGNETRHLKDESDVKQSNRTYVRYYNVLK